MLLDLLLLKSKRTQSIDKMNSKEVCSIHISPKVNIPTQIYFETKNFSLWMLIWREIHTLPGKVTVNAYLRSFLYKILKNALYLNKKLHTFGLSNTQLWPFFKMEEHIISPLFYYCRHVQDIWNQVQACLSDCLDFPQFQHHRLPFWLSWCW